MSDSRTLLGAITLRFAVWIDPAGADGQAGDEQAGDEQAGDEQAGLAVLRDIEIPDLLTIGGGVIDWEGATYDVDAGTDDEFADELAEIRVLRTLHAADPTATGRVLGAHDMGVAYEIIATGKRFWNAYATAAQQYLQRGELRPLWRHDHGNAIWAYLGQYLHDGQEYDLHVAAASSGAAPAVLARWSDEESSEASGLGRGPASGPLAEAERRAIATGRLKAADTDA